MKGRRSSRLLLLLVLLMYCTSTVVGSIPRFGRSLLKLKVLFDLQGKGNNVSRSSDGAAAPIIINEKSSSASSGSRTNTNSSTTSSYSDPNNISTSDSDSSSSSDSSTDSNNSIGEEGAHITSLLRKYGGKLECINIAAPAPHSRTHHPSHLPYHHHQYTIYLCGSIHVANSSACMVTEVMRAVRPNYVVIELCSERISSFWEQQQQQQQLQHLRRSTNSSLPHNSYPITIPTLLSVCKQSWQERSWQSLAVGVLCWMQQEASATMGSPLGGELLVAVEEARAINAPVILGDRSYSVTIQRVFDKLGKWEKFRIGMTMLFEVITSKFVNLKDFILKSAEDQSFIRDELEELAQSFPTFSGVIISERDEYLARNIQEVADIGSSRSRSRSSSSSSRRRRSKGIISKLGKHDNHHPPTSTSTGTVVVAVLGAGHLKGVLSHLQQQCGNITDERMVNISSSSATNHIPTWPGPGRFAVLPRPPPYLGTSISMSPPTPSSSSFTPPPSSSSSYPIR